MARGSVRPLSAGATHRPIRSLRLAFKKAFAAYFVALSTPTVADPTEAFDAAEAYLSGLLSQLGPEEFMRKLDDETTHLAGELEQDLRQRWRGRAEQLEFGDLEDRLRECFEHGLSRLDMPHTGSR